MIFIGIDPGLGGGFAWWDDRNPMMQSMEMPRTERAISDLFRELHDESLNGIHALIELVHAMPGFGPECKLCKRKAGQGSKSIFTFGEGYGGLRMGLTCNAIPFETVTPRTWMAEFGMRKEPGETKTHWKRRLIAKGEQLFPDLEITLKTADAVLICEYARRRCKSPT